MLNSDDEIEAAKRNKALELQAQAKNLMDNDVLTPVPN